MTVAAEPQDVAIIDQLRKELAEARALLQATAVELNKWGWGDMHYGSTPQAESVVLAVTAVDVFLDGRS